MYISIACFSELLEIICSINKMAGEGHGFDDDKRKVLEQKTLDFVNIAVDAYKQQHVSA